MKPLMAANWKMHKTISEAVDFLNQFKDLVSDVNDVDILICGPYTALKEMSNVVQGTNISLGAENMFWEEEGAFTGEISPLMLKDAGCEYVMLGHSERRKFFNETNEAVNKKVNAALKHDLKPIVCIGETFDEREAGNADAIIEDQLRGALEGISSDNMKKITIAYEPVWAISGGDASHKPATSQDAQEMHKFIRELITKLYDQQVSDSTRILYGGSMKPENVSELMSMEDINGGLVGGASLDPEKFSKVVRFN